MRYWTGAETVYSTDAEGPSVIISGSKEDTVRIATDKWRLDSEDNSRVWRPQAADELIRLYRPALSQYYQPLSAAIQTMTPSGTYPPLANGLKSEAKRLLPSITAGTNQHFSDFVDYLKAEFGFHQNSFSTDETVKLVEGMSPEMLVLLDGEPTVLPELPPAYTAPKMWRNAMWWVNNHMFGPAMDDDVPPEKQVVYQNIQRSNTSHTAEVEGLVYYISALMVATWAAWSDEKDMTYLNGFMDLIMSGQRYWQNV